MGDEPLPAHSAAEAYLYLMALRCPRCGRGPLRIGKFHGDSVATEIEIALPSDCASCGAALTTRFRIAPGRVDESDPSDRYRPARINRSSEPSRIIDLAQWLTLFRVLSESAANTADKAESRRLGFDAAQCLEEALKFYGDDNDLPPDEALFHDSSRRRRREHPEWFSRQRLINLRHKLPSADVMERHLARDRRRRHSRWWKR